MSRTKRLTIGELRKAIKGLPANMPVYTADHDHSEWETNGRALYACVRDQSEMDEYAQQKIDKDDHWKIKGKYLVIGV